MTTLESNKNDLKEIPQMIEKELLDPAIDIVTNYLKKAQVRKSPRLAKPWFDGDCYHLRKETLNLLHRVRNVEDKNTLEA